MAKKTYFLNILSSPCTLFIYLALTAVSEKCFDGYYGKSEVIGPSEGTAQQIIQLS